MEEILASIRRIISDDRGTSASEETRRDALRLEELAEELAVTAATVAADIRDAPEAPSIVSELTTTADDLLFADHVPDEPVSPPGIAAGPASAFQSIETLVSTEATAAVGQAFDRLSHTILSANARTLEDLVRELLKPMLKTWLDDNLPPLVERLVRAEIERVARGRI